MAKLTEALIPVIVLNWNSEEDTLECLNSIKISSTNGFVPVIVDNGSAPESLDYLKYKCGLIFNNIIYIGLREILTDDASLLLNDIYKNTVNTLIFIENGKNLGFARGNNIGIKFAELLNADWVMLLNNDTIVTKDTFSKLIKFKNNNPSIKAISPQIRYYHQSNKVWNCGGLLTYFGSRKYNYANVDYWELPTKDYDIITFTTGCALLFNFKQTGTLSENYFFGEEDYEFSLRINSMGIQMVCLYDSIVFHKVSSTINKRSTLIGTIYLYYISRLINTRHYYSKLRWQITRLLAYMYIPFLLVKNGLNPSKSISLLLRINAYVRKNEKINKTEFEDSLQIK